MTPSTCNVFALLVVIAVLTFLTSLVSLDTHLTRGDQKGVKLAKRAKKVEKSGASQYVDYITEKFHELTGPILPVWHHSPDATSYEADDGTTDDDSENDDSENEEEEQQKEKSAHRRPIPTKEKCVIKFTDTCKMNPIVKYWDDSTDCYISPLKGISGLSAPLEDRRFIVFQADLGGWNNIRMGLEAVILFAQVTGRILVIPPPAVLYLLHFNKKWKDNKSTMEDYFDFSRLKLKNGLEVISMKEFLTMIAAPGLLSLPLPDNNTDLSKGPLYEYLEKACYVRQWSPGKIFIGFNMTSLTSDDGLIPARGSISSDSEGSDEAGDAEEENSIYGITMDDKPEGPEGNSGAGSEKKSDVVTVDGENVYGISQDDEAEEGEEEEAEETRRVKSRRRSLQLRRRLEAVSYGADDDALTAEEEEESSEGTTDDTPHRSSGGGDSSLSWDQRVRAVFGTLNQSLSAKDKERIETFAFKRQVLPYDYEFHQQRAIYFPAHEDNRLLTHFYSMLFFTSPREEHRAKRYIRDRLRYHDQIFCTASVFIEKLMMLEEYHAADKRVVDKTVPRAESERGWNYFSSDKKVIDLQLYSEEEYIKGEPKESILSHIKREPQYVAFHIRRGDFQQKHTRLAAETIVEYTAKLVPDRADRIAYIATDEGNRSFFEPFFQQYKAVYFLKDIQNRTNIENINQNYIGMIEQVICANAHTFIGTPLSTFTAYITRMRGYSNRTLTVLPTDEEHFFSGQKLNKAAKDRIPASTVNRQGLYDRTYYFMKHHMFQLHTKPHMHLPLWIRDFIEAFVAIDDDNSLNT